MRRRGLDLAAVAVVGLVVTMIIAVLVAALRP